MTPYYTKDGQEVFLKQRLDLGGEGAVWLTDLPEMLAKIYHQDHAQYAQKISYMVENPPKDPMENKGHRAIAWPQNMLFDEQGIFRGFLMPRISGALQLNHIYNAKLRRISAPGFTWHYLHVTAMNVASIMGALHNKGYVVGDLKTDNFLVTDRALVSIIDTDSFQIQTQDDLFCCSVGSEGFIPPELLGVDLAFVERNVYQDAFGLAILIHLLLLGYHPFSSSFSGQVRGIPLSRDEAIAGGFSLYSKNFSGDLPPYVIEKEALHPSVQEAFFRCFNEGLQDPTKRPTADEWQVILQSVLWEIKQCGQATQHFYFGDTCFWCKRFQKTGIDVFSEGHHIRALNVDFQFQKAIDTQDVREVARLWQMHMDLRDNPRFQHHGPFIRKAIQYVETLDQFKDFCESAESDDEILAWWLDHEALSYFPHNPHELINNRLVHEFLKESRERSQAFESLKKEIEAAELINKFGAVRFEEVLEENILKAFAAYRWPDIFKEKNRSSFQRVENAEHNLAIWTLFKDAFKQKNDQKILVLWEKERSILECFPLTGEQKQAMVNAEKSSKKIKEIHAIIKSENSLEQLIEWWEKNPLFHQSSFRQEIVDGLSIESHVQRAQKQSHLLKAMQEISHKGDFQAFSALWDKDLCEGYKEFSFFAPMAKAAETIHDLWKKVKRAIQEEESDFVLAHWREEDFAASTQQDGLAPMVQKIFQDAYATVQFPSITGPSMECHRDFTLVRWHWPALASPESLCVIGVSSKEHARFQNKSDFLSLRMVKKRGQIGSALIPGKFSKDHRVQVWAAQKVCGDLLTFGAPLTIDSSLKTEVFYDVYVHSHAWRGWRKKFGPRVDIKLYARRAVTLPSLRLIVANDRPPIPRDDRATLMAVIPSFALEGSKEKTLSFSLENPEATHAYYRLEVDTLEDPGFYFIRREGC